MESNCPAYIHQISPEDWEKTTASVKKLVEEMAVRQGQLEKNLVDHEAKLEQLLEKINRTSKNSSHPPSSDLPNAPKQESKRKSGKKRGGQPGHKGHNRSLYLPEQCESITDHYPKTCGCCGEELGGEDANPYRHQVVEIPPINPIVVSHLVSEKTGQVEIAP